MDLSSSDEDDCELEYWNNWIPSSEPVIDKPSSVKGKNKKIFETPFYNAELRTLGNWIPPSNFFNFRKTITRKSITLDVGKEKEIQKLPKVVEEKGIKAVSYEKKINLDWGERVELNDVSNYDDGDCFWGIVNLGMFANIKLWVNEYNNICGSADGKISNPSSSEKTHITITKMELLRKMLNLSNPQWLSLCETVQKDKAQLKFDAMENYNERKLTSLEKLWFYICKMRHLRPSQSMLVRLCGAVKNLKKFEIIPKIEVLDIRSLTGEVID